MTVPRAPRLIIICGLPGSGKTTLAKQLEKTVTAIRFSPDEWLKALNISIYDEEKRAKIESLQWDFAQKLLSLGQIVIIEWGTWGRSERDTLRLRARELGPLSNCTICKARSTHSSTESRNAPWKIRPSDAWTWFVGPSSSRRRRRKSFPCSMSLSN